jgi:hypothetical protein
MQLEAARGGGGMWCPLPRTAKTIANLVSHTTVLRIPLLSTLQLRQTSKPESNYYTINTLPHNKGTLQKTSVDLQYMYKN